MAKAKTVIVTGASQGIEAGIASALDRGYRVVAETALRIHNVRIILAGNLALVDGDIADPQTATKIAETAVGRFGSIDGLVNNAGIFFTKRFIDYTAEDFRSLVSTNLGGFLYVTQLAIKQMLSQETGGSIVTITAAAIG